MRAFNPKLKGSIHLEEQKEEPCPVGACFNFRYYLVHTVPCLYHKAHPYNHHPRDILACKHCDRNHNFPFQNYSVLLLRTVFYTDDKDHIYSLYMYHMFLYNLHQSCILNIVMDLGTHKNLHCHSLIFSCIKSHFRVLPKR